MLSPTAVTKYLARPFDDWRVYKDLSDAQLDALAIKHAIPAELWARLRDRPQKIMTLIGLRQPRFLFFADMGTGKTFIALALAQLLRQRGSLRKQTLVLAPMRSNKDEWRYEIEKHFPRLEFAVLPADTVGKWATVEGGAPLLIETYSGLYHMLCESVPGRGKNKLQPHLPSLKRLRARLDGLVLDESTAVKNPQKLPFRLCRQLAKDAAMVIGLTGTPHGRDPIDLWAQFFLVDGGETLGEHITLYRAAFFREQFNGFATEYKFRKRQQGLLNDILANRSIRFKAKDSDLPALLAMRKYVSISAEAMLYYQRAREAMQNAGNLREVRNNFLRMRQISSGFVGFLDDARGERAELTFPDNPKLELLLAKVQEALPNKQIIYYEFTVSAMRMRKELDRLGIGWQHLWSGQTDTDTAQRAWRESARYPVLLIQNQFGIGLNLQLANYAHFFESPISPIIRAQCERRFRRQGSEHDRVYQIDYIVRDTVDEAILDMLKEGKDLLQHIIDGRGRPQAAAPRVDESDTQRENIARVYQRIAPGIIEFFRTHGPGARFHVEELRAWIEARFPNTAPDSAGRIMRDLREHQIIDYTVINRRASLYEITATVRDA
jgi:hypothetical protein